MGHIGLKELAHQFLSDMSPEAFTPEEVADVAIEQGIKSRSKNPRQSLASTLRRWARPGDAMRDERFEQRYERGRLVVFVRSHGYLVEAPSKSRPETGDGNGLEGFDSDDLANLLVQQGEFTHKLDALKALGNLSLRGIVLPQGLLDELRVVHRQECEAQQRKKELISQLRSLLDTA